MGQEVKQDGFLMNYIKYLKYTDDLYIYYYTSSSKLVLLKKQVYFDKNGYFDQSGISWEGELVQHRVGDLLPYEYSIK